MLHRLQGRLALSHILPILIVVPLLSLVLLYQLERTYFLDNLAEDLAAQGALIAQFTAGNAALWHDPQAAQTLVQHLQVHTPASITLLDSQAHVLYSTVAGDDQQVGQLIDSQLVRQALAGQTAWTVDRNAKGEELAVDVVVPIMAGRTGPEGFVRLSHRLTDFQQRLNQQRWLVLVTLFAGAGIALVLGLVLARSLALPLLRLTNAVARFSPEKAPENIPENGPDELKLLAATFNRLSRHLHEADQARKILLSGIVHELGRPLGSIKTAAQTVQQSDEPALIAELAAGIDDQVDQLSLHLDDLALLGELELEGLTLVCEPVDMGALLAAQERQFARLAAQQSLLLTCRLDATLPVIQADPRRLSQIIGNLLHNACKYTPAGGHITLSANLERAPDQADGPDVIVVRVADNGPGIAPQEQEQIFKLYYRGPSQRRIRQGMGIGLALARQLAEAHGGSLTVASRLGAGAVFSLRLPVRQ